MPWEGWPCSENSYSEDGSTTKTGQGRSKPEAPTKSLCTGGWLECQLSDQPYGIPERAYPRMLLRPPTADGEVVNCGVWGTAWQTHYCDVCRNQEGGRNARSHRRPQTAASELENRLISVYSAWPKPPHDLRDSSVLTERGWQAGHSSLCTTSLPSQWQRWHWGPQPVKQLPN